MRTHAKSDEPLNGLDGEVMSCKRRIGEWKICEERKSGKRLTDKSEAIKRPKSREQVVAK